MSEEHTDNLKKARARLIEQRRAFVKVLAGPYERGKTEQARERFLDMQTAIEAMNRAIEDEERSQGSVHGFLVYWRYVSVAQVYVKDSCLHQVFVQWA